MRIKKPAFLFSLCVVPLLAVVWASVPADADWPSDMDRTGTWVLDHYASDDLAAAMNNRRSGQTMIRRQESNDTPRMITRVGVLADMESLGAAAERLTLLPDLLRLEFAGGQQIVLSIDGVQRQVTWPGGAEVDVSADWIDGTLQVERTTGYVTVVDLLAPDIDAARLTVVTSIDGRLAGEVNLWRHYDLESVP